MALEDSGFCKTDFILTFPVSQTPSFTKIKVFKKSDNISSDIPKNLIPVQVEGIFRITLYCNSGRFYFDFGGGDFFLGGGWIWAIQYITPPPVPCPKRSTVSGFHYMHVNTNTGYFFSRYPIARECLSCTYSAQDIQDRYTVYIKKKFLFVLYCVHHVNIEEGSIKKKRQRSSLQFGGQNLFNSLLR